MNGARYSVGAIGVVPGLGLIASTTGACSGDREDFTHGPEELVPVADAGPDAETCYTQCSLDGRSVVDSCTGAEVEKCADDLACGAAKCQKPCDAAAADRSSDGCDFYFSAPRFTASYPQSCHAAFVVNTSNQPATVTLEREGVALDLSHSLFRAVPNSTDLELLDGPIAPGESAIVFVSDRDQTKARTLNEKLNYIGCPRAVTAAVEQDFGIYGSRIAGAFRMTSNVPVGVTSMYPYGGAASFVPSATLVLPVSAWAREHVVVNGWEKGLNGRPITQIYAAEDDTEITLLGRKDILNGDGFAGAAAGQPAKIKLQKGQFAQLHQTEELTGSFVFSNKPTVTLGGNDCANIANTATACDTLAQQIPPFEQWGTEYVAAAYRPRIKDGEEIVWYRIVGARDGTELAYDPVKPPGAPLTLSAGEFVLFRARASEPFVVRSHGAKHPFYLAMHMSGGGGSPTEPRHGSMGDPEFVNVVPAGQYRNSYSFYADSTYPENSLVIVRKRHRGEFKDVWLECAGDLPDWKAIDTKGDYEYRRVDLSRDFGPGDTFGDKRCITGLQRMRSEGEFTATIWGWGVAASYAYPGGMAIRKLVTTPLTVN